MTSEEVKVHIARICERDHYYMVSCVRQYVYSQDIAEDCVQDAYVAAIEQAQQIREPLRLRSWLIRVAKRKAVHRISSYNKIMKVCIRVQPCSDEDTNLEISSVLIANTVSSVFHTLPPKAEEIMRLRYVDGHTFIEIAKQLGMSTVAVRQAHHRAKSRLRKHERYIRSLMTE